MADKVISTYRVCKVATLAESGGFPTYQLQTVHRADFEDYESAQKWIEELDAMHKENEYVILQVFRV